VVDPLTVKKKWIKLFLPLVDTFQMDPADPMALKSFIDFIKQDKRCVFFPEGRLTMTGTLMKIYEAPGLAADKADAKLLPVHIQGAQYSHFSRLRGKVRIRWMPKITLTIFPAQEMGIPAELKGRQRRQQIGLKLYDLMKDMIFSSSGFHQTLFNALLDAKAMHGGRHKCVEDTDRVPISYQQIITRSFILGGLIAKQTETGENAGILLPNLISTVIVFFAMQAYHRVPAMINFSSGIKSVLLACEIARIKTVYTAEKFIKAAQLEELVIAMEHAGVKVVYLESMRSQVGVWEKSKGLLFSLAPRFVYRKINKLRRPQKDFDANLPAVILFTSGSEGLPKGVVLSHKNIQANRFQIGACVDFTTTDKILNVLPMFHSFGLTAGVLLPMLSGVQVFLYPSPLHYRIVPELSYDINATIIFSTDTFLTGYAKYAHNYDFYSVRYIFSGAEKLREETANIWAKKFGVRVFEGYGATETSPVLAVNTPMHNQTGTVGRLMPGIQYRLRPVEGIAEGGALEVSGPNIMKGYLLADKPGVIQPPKDGWYDTGDVVSVDEEGYLTIKGRIKRFAKIAGEMVSLPMVEQQVNLLWPDFQHAVISMPHQRKGEQVVLVTTNMSATREELVAHALKQRMAEIAIPKKILTIKEMLLLGSGKTSYVAVAEWAQQQLANDVDESDEEFAVA
jgi:acyl-[acyl-carrier-protein]-phospholipid O-acyltransferase/long-chain-fatty-acid--[acyl-carrier-protein] ligase